MPRVAHDSAIITNGENLSAYILLYGTLQCVCMCVYLEIEVVPTL